ncbi:unnamed protein product [Closterium sp. NIES-65]|nr:unnamed protein product [Closterium sp. NIES-65]
MLRDFCILECSVLCTFAASALAAAGGFCKIESMFSRFRHTKDGPDNLNDEVATSVALGLEVASDTTYAKSKVPEGALAGAVAFVVTYLWLVSKGRDGAIADTEAKRAAKKAGAPDLGVTIIVAA